MSTIAVALTLACVAVAMLGGSLLAQTGQGVYQACAAGKKQISAAGLPEVVDEDRCPVGGRTIVDGRVGTVVPEPGTSVTAAATGPEGDQHLTVSNPRGDEILLDGVGAEPGSDATASLSARASGPSACRDRYYTRWDAKVYSYNRWYANTGSIPDNLSKVRAVAAMKKGGSNIYKVQDSCGIRDRVKGELRYKGGTSRSTDVNSNASCNATDGRSVIGFGDLPADYTAFICAWTYTNPDGLDRRSSSDIRLNKKDHSWTTSVRGSCRGRYDVESSVTHERGHTFGLGDVSESSHGNLTMSEESNGPCQTSERSLGRGDAIGLNSKY